MNKVQVGFAVAGALAMVAAPVALFALDQSFASRRAATDSDDVDPENVAAQAASMLNDYDRRSLNGNLDGSVQIAQESAQKLRTGEHTMRHFGLPIVTGYGTYDETTGYKYTEYDGKSLLDAADKAGSADGVVTLEEMTAFLGDFDRSPTDGRLDSDEQHAFRSEFADAFAQHKYSTYF